MNLWSKSLLCAALCLICVYCKGDGSVGSIQGVLISLTSEPVPSSPDPVLKVAGHDASEFTTQYQASTTGGNQRVFAMEGVETDQSQVFELSHSQLASVISYVFESDELSSISLASLTNTALTSIVSLGNAAISMVDTNNKATVLGQVSSSGGGCGQAHQAVLVNASDGSAPIGSSDSLYFNSDGSALVTGSFADDECNFVIFNLDQGNYILKIVSSSSQVLAQYNIVAVTGKISVGVDLL
ncbi:MAG: hypothetical protein KDD52_04540 [Bdellovibrionales bacterium]|nr:hypothetical protein [Bdellovibrionales bacterium]